MFINSISGAVTDLTPNSQTRFLCTVSLSVPHDEISIIQPGRLIAAENMFHAARDKRYTILQIVDYFPVPEEKKSSKKNLVTLTCTSTPIGQELRYKNAKTGPEIQGADTFPAFDGAAHVLDDDITRSVIHHIAPESRLEENGSRVDIGKYRSNPDVKVGLDAAALLRGNAAVISARPRARTTIATNLIQSLLQQSETPVHVVYCDVNNHGTLSLAPQLTHFPHASVLCLNDKFVPASVFSAMRNPGDRSAHKRAVLDYLDMMILPSVLEQRRHDFSFPISTWMRENRVTIFRPNEQTVDQFITEISVDILDGLEEDVEEYMNELMNGIAETYRGERFSEKNTKDMLDMIDDFSQESKSHAARRTLYDLKAEIQSVFETYSKDVPPATRKTIQDLVGQLNSDDKSSLLVVQGQKTTDILRFIGTLSQTLIDERLKRLKIRTPVLFIFNNIDEYVGRNGAGLREAGSDRFNDTLQTLLTNGRRHGLGFCLTLETAASLDQQLARKIQTYFIGPITFAEEPAGIADLLNLSQHFLQPAVRYEDGDFLYTASDSPYHRRVPLPVITQKNAENIHQYLDEMKVEQERRRQEYMAQEEERRKRQEQEREERRKREEKEREERRKREEKEKEEAERRKKEEAEKQRLEDEHEDDAEQSEDDAQEEKTSSSSSAKSSSSKSTTRSRRRRGGKHSRSEDSEARESDKTGDDEAGEDSAPESGDAGTAKIEKTSDQKADEQKAADKNADGEKDSAKEEKPARKSTRGKRGGRGRKTGRKEEPASSSSSAKEDSEKSSDAAKSSSSSTLTIEEFDPNAGKSKADNHKGEDQSGKQSSAGNTDESGATADADSSEDKEKQPEKKPQKRAPRRGARRGTGRSRKSSSTSSDKKGDDE
ncbi:hypothetical protein KQI65_11975 [bacterium]|nr:hypothetical protein [bacterium]